MKSIKTKGMILSLSLILFVVITLGASAYYRFRSILVDEVNEAMVRVAQESADHLDNYIDQFVSPLISIAENEAIKSMDWELQKEVISNQINPLYLNIALVDINGVARYTDGTNLDLSDREYIIEALKGKVSFSEVIISRKTNTPVIMVAVPIYTGDNINGAVIARLDVDFLSDYAMTHGYGEHGRAYIISDEGYFISRPVQEKSETIFNLYEMASSDDRYASFSNFVSDNKEIISGYGKYVFDDNIIMMGYASVAETNWKIYIGTNEKDTLQGLEGLTHMFITIIIITLLICSVLAWISVNRFSNSIIELDNLFSLGAQGDLTIRFTPKTKDEIGRVGISFNRMMDKIKTLTHYDPLTLLLNQYVLENDIEKLVNNENKQDFSLIMIAIDRFGLVNETYGYKVGDSILYEAAKRISSFTSDGYQVYRYKGDKYVILCKGDVPEEQVDVRAQDLLISLKEVYQIDKKTIEINFNIGVFFCTDETRDEDPLKAVTQAKNYAKYLGSNQIQKFGRHVYQKLMVMKELQADILDGLKEDQFFLVYQPLYYLGTETIAELEALIRWEHPKRGFLYPDQFIELAEQAGSIVNIDQWVLETACKQIKSWKESNKTPIKLSVNISAKSFETKKFIPNLVALVHKYDVDPSLLQLEITERMVIRNVEESINKLKELRAMGIHIAIDDFGIGYSSLSYIIRLPIDSIKIDKSFIQNITYSKEAKTIVSTIINLCKTLNLNVIAEGIESRIELEYLKLHQCDIGQGYYFSKPVSIVEIEMKHSNMDIEENHI